MTTLYSGWLMSDDQAYDNFLDRSARALLIRSQVGLKGVAPHYCERCDELITLHNRWLCIECDELMHELFDDMNPSEHAFIMDSDCTCTMDFIGGEVVERTCERCRIREMYQNDDSIPY